MTDTENEHRERYECRPVKLTRITVEDSFARNAIVGRAYAERWR